MTCDGLTTAAWSSYVQLGIVDNESRTPSPAVVGTAYIVEKCTKSFGSIIVRKLTGDVIVFGQIINVRVAFAGHDGINLDKLCINAENLFSFLFLLFG